MVVALVWLSLWNSGDLFPGLMPDVSPVEDLKRSLPSDSFWPWRSPCKAGLAGTKSILWSPSFIFLTLSYTLEGYAGNIFVFWFYLYLVQVRHFDLLRAGRLSSLPWLLCIVSIPMGGIVSDYLVTGFLGSCWGRRVVPMTGLTLSGILLALGAQTANANAAVVYFTLATAFVLSAEGPFWATMVDLAGPHSGTAGGVMNCGSNIGGMLSPLLTPIMAAYMGWKNALDVGAAIALVSAGLWLGVSSMSQERLG